MILVKDFRKGLGDYATGITEISYGNLTLLCSIIIFKDRTGVYIKMPQCNDTEGGKKFNVASWDSKEISDKFQEEVKKQLAEKFPEALIIPDITGIKRKRRYFKPSHKKHNSIKTPALQPKKEEYKIGKARPVSKFLKK